MHARPSPDFSPRPAALGGRDVRSRLRNRRGAFTLIEIISVLTIIGIISGIAFPKFQEAVDRAKVARAIGDLRAIAIDLAAANPLPATLADIGRGGLDPWGRPYRYVPFPENRPGNTPPAGARKDRFLVPINSRYDLFSLGKDGASIAPLTARPSRDDVIVANDGGWIGLAKNF
ncbi:MAG: prepilin-type N-terminal cleavage/methylation domain-containing protein [Gemmatimonadaceae bacterium]|jgi:general secretion pathway protein G|nr:prepilin-type N-terminal cleavage/methylation domain-containing protein [Gemmatimonadaceae bacterium]